MDTSTPTNYPALNSIELTHAIQALANATSEINLQKNTTQPIDWTKIAIFGGIALIVLIFIIQNALLLF